MGVGEVQFCQFGNEVHARAFGHYLQVDRLARLYTNYEFIARDRNVSLGTGAENVKGYVLELNPHFRLALIQSWNADIQKSTIVREDSLQVIRENISSFAHSRNVMHSSSRLVWSVRFERMT